MLAILRLERWGQVDPRGSLKTQPKLMVRLPVSESVREQRTQEQKETEPPNAQMCINTYSCAHESHAHIDLSSRKVTFFPGCSLLTINITPTLRDSDFGGLK